MAAPQRPRPRRGPSARDVNMTELARDLRRCRTRADRLWLAYQAINEEDDAAASLARHQSWSDAVEEALAISESISRQHVHDLQELTVQFEATWWIVEDDSILDDSARRWLRRFRRSLRQLASER